MHTVDDIEMLARSGGLKGPADAWTILRAAIENYAAQRVTVERAGGSEAGPEEERIEAAYWRFDARRKGYAQWLSTPMSERDAFKAELRKALAAEKTRAQMRLVANGWRRADA